MIQRCTYSKAKKWEHYGGRGIAVCERWLRNYDAFLADMGERPDGTTLDRFPNNDGNYEPGNCRWATRAEQDRMPPGHVPEPRRLPTGQGRGGARPGAGRPPVAGAPQSERLNVALTEAERAEIEAAVPDGRPVGRWIVEAAVMRARSGR